MDEMMGADLKKVKPTLTLSEDDLEGIGDLNIDDKLSLSAKVTVVEVRKDRYEKDMPYKATVEIDELKLDKKTEDEKEIKEEEATPEEVKEPPKTKKTKKAKSPEQEISELALPKTEEGEIKTEGL